MVVSLKKDSNSLCKIAFDAQIGKFGEKVDTLVSSSQTGKSISFPATIPKVFTIGAAICIGLVISC